MKGFHRSRSRSAETPPLGEQTLRRRETQQRGTEQLSRLPSGTPQVALRFRRRALRDRAPALWAVACLPDAVGDLVRRGSIRAARDFLALAGKLCLPLHR